jgi:hypothetical protein
MAPTRDGATGLTSRRSLFTRVQWRVNTCRRFILLSADASYRRRRLTLLLEKVLLCCEEVVFVIVPQELTIDHVDRLRCMELYAIAVELMICGRG